MNDKQQLAAMGAELRLTEEQAKRLAERMPQTGALQVIDDEPLCMAKRIKDLEAQMRVMGELLREARPSIEQAFLSAIECSDTEGDIGYLLCRVDDALSRNLPATTVPEGWQLVPVEPTPAMIEKACDELISYPLTLGHKAKLVWAAMLAAAPKPDSAK